MRILGIDPGLTRCGVGVVDAQGRAVRLVSVDVLRSGADEALEQRLHRIATGIEAAIAEHRPDAVALERVFVQHNVRTVMGVAQISGLVLRAAAASGIAVELHTPSEVKAAVTGYGQADKRQVGAMVQRILGLDAAPRPADAADALAIAICHAWSARSAAPTAALTPAQRAWQAAERAARR
ncbi:crossover junction endodeoxyribonuclease RuvC [Agrococcus sp. SGAir0287]|uniref:crossover junction endodeoxyribonuclease RuvC n=1 Tax=Agrococcus sp. SGAir0287 TaxID=2070347 RepID=UPI0010CD2F02|nr:crossover junction endodeoxyribonuclease RuvC [Agrococcus sp. SGAir0287]QCR19337.1 crossover junction endodeoxyribonuclease RuvC [Agrococcus sp. SGAir0287]